MVEITYDLKSPLYLSQCWWMKWVELTCLIIRVLKTVSKHKRWRREGRISCPKLLLSTPRSVSTTEKCLKIMSLPACIEIETVFAEKHRDTARRALQKRGLGSARPVLHQPRHKPKTWGSENLKTYRHKYSHLYSYAFDRCFM